MQEDAPDQPGTASDPAYYETGAPSLRRTCGLGVLLATPAPGLAEAVQKIELATEYGRLIDELEPVCADLRRFISQERA